MTLTRKEFFREGARALGRTLLAPGRLVAPAPQPAAEVPAAGPLVIDNRRCLAQRGGCFTCLERCPEEALAIEPGIGLRHDPQRCTSCGTCVASCPLTPAALRLAELPPSDQGVSREGESSC